ncbi:MAG TPA: hypothetical protein PLB89_17655 [Flavobacteriales bacterium]|nr:hypothetical protein [Flavobacteriales bacterium]
MSKRKTGAAEAAIHTNNEHWNGYALAFLCKVKEGGKFPDVDKAMDLYCDVLGIIQDHHDKPLKGDRAAEALLAKAGMNEEQCVEINLAAYTYLKGSEFDVDLSVGIALLKGRTKAKEAEPWTKGTREGLQELVRRELAELPETLKALDPKDRIATLCKLLPYVFPKLNNVEGKDEQPTGWNW